MDFTAGETVLDPRDEAPTSGSGWVSDLLRRASQEEPVDTIPRSRAKEDGLKSLSNEIAAALDTNSAQALWQRYQEGERNVFERSIYTGKGQQTFDEIRGKYANDANFRVSVDKYVADFERLIADVARNDADNMMAETYLTSDTGKVYTMLAHAAGRFD